MVTEPCEASWLPVPGTLDLSMIHQTASALHRCACNLVHLGL